MRNRLEKGCAWVVQVNSVAMVDAFPQASKRYAAGRICKRASKPAGVFVQVSKCVLMRVFKCEYVCRCGHDGVCYHTRVPTR